MRSILDLPVLRDREPPPWLARNLRVKLLAMLLALASWVVVVYAANPPDSRQILVHVQQDAQQLPGRYVLAHPIPDITVRINGTREHVDAFQASSIRATPSFDAIRRTGVQQLPLTVVDTDPNVDLSDVPGSVSTDVDLLGTTTVPVVVRTSKTQVGYQISSATATPDHVRLTGPQRELSFAQAVVDFNFGNRTSNLTQDGVPVIAVDPRSGTRPLSDVTVNEGTVRVTVVIKPVDGSIISLVIPQFTGTVAPGHMVSALTVDPQTVTLSGPENLLNGADHVTTAPIPLTGLTSDRTFTVQLQPQTGLKADVVTVNVHVFVTALPEAVITPTPASPAPSVTPRSTSTSTPAPSCTPSGLPPTACPSPRPT
jgi:YbbR domain-containing protein